jgi:hypothetical protein
MSSQSFVFLLGPSRQMGVETAEGRVQRRSIVATIVIEPPSEHRIEHLREIVERLVTAPMHSPAPHRVAHLLGCLRTDSRGKVGEVTSKAILRLARAKGKPEKVKVLLRIRSSPHTILAVDDLGLLRMYLQPTVSQALSERRLELLGLLLTRAVTERIVGIAFKENARLVASHPDIERIMQKEITQHGAEHAANNVAKRSIEFFVRLSRDQLRPTYGQGFRGAPLQTDTKESRLQTIRAGGSRAKTKQTTSEIPRSEEEV